jgi:hypothetical protein
MWNAGIEIIASPCTRLEPWERPASTPLGNQLPWEPQPPPGPLLNKGGGVWRAHAILISNHGD